METMRAAYDEIYVFAMGRPGFPVQYVTDAFTAQTADDSTKPMALVFALLGLYLHVERQFSGHDVQNVHMQLARRKREWPLLALPEDRGSITAADVLAAGPGPERDQAIDAWCQSVWNAFHDSRETIIAFLHEHGIT